MIDSIDCSESECTDSAGTVGEYCVEDIIGQRIRLIRLIRVYRSIYNSSSRAVVLIVCILLENKKLERGEKRLVYIPLTWLVKSIRNQALEINYYKLTIIN